MLRRFFHVALRQSQKNPFYFSLNLLGLTTGIACCLIIFQYVKFEMSFDRFHEKGDRIYRVNYDMTMAGSQTISPSVPVFVGPQMKSQFPEVEASVRYLDGFSERTLSYGDKVFDEPGFSWADSNFFEVFDFNAVQGNLKTALSRPGTLVITQAMARKYFGDEDPLGKTLLVNNTRAYEITAVMEDVPANSHFSFNFLTSLYSIKDLDESMSWNNPNYATFLLLKPGADAVALEEKVERLIHPEGEAPSENILHLPLEPLHKVHFNTQVYNYGGRLAITDFSHVIVFGSVGILILFIACINYVNLATSRASTRAKEVGMRKAVGATFPQLITQFMAESFFMILPAMVLSVLIVRLLLPILNTSLGKKIPFDPLAPEFLWIALGGWIVLSVLAGFYPALVLARFKPIAVLKGSVTYGSDRWSLRKALVVFQFTISTMLIAGTFILLGQLNFMQSQKLGLDKEHVFLIRGNSDLTKNINSFSQTLRAIPGVQEVSTTWRSPFRTVIGNGFTLSPNPGNDATWAAVGAVAADEHYLPTLGIALKAGRAFDPARYAGDSVENEFIVNETFLAQFALSMDEAVGKQVTLGMVGAGTIVGVMQDFHTSSLHTKVGPIVLFNDPEYRSSLLVRADGERMQEVIAAIGSEWTSAVPNRPFNYLFLDEEYGALYRTEMQMSALITIFSGIAIAIACFGLLGLSSFTSVQRAREIGIRKVMGATTESIVLLLSRGYLILLLLASVIAVPITYYLMNQWLQGFAYHITPGPLYFGGAVAAVIVIAWGTVGYHSVKASLANPANTLKYE